MITPLLDQVQPCQIKAFEWEPIGTHRGMYIYDRSYFKALAKTGVDVVWVTSDHVDGDGYQVWPVFNGMFGEEWIVWRGARYMYGLWQLLCRAKQEMQTRRVIIHQQFVIYPAAELAFVKLARAFGITCILAPHDVIPFSSPRLTRYMLPQLYRSYDALIVHSNAAFLELKKMLGESGPRIWMVPHGNLNAYRSDANLSQETARAMLEIPEKSSVVLFLGQIKQDKGLDVLLRAVPMIIDRHPDTLLVVAGHPYRCDVSVYERLIDSLGIRSRVRIRWEYIPEEQMAAYYRASDVVALPYLRSYQSGVCFTAYAYKRPVVATSVGGLKDQVSDGETGYLVSPNHPGELAEAIIRMLDNKATARQMGERGYSWSESIGDWSQIAHSTIAIYQDCLCKSKPVGSKE